MGMKNLSLNARKKSSPRAKQSQWIKDFADRFFYSQMDYLGPRSEDKFLFALSEDGFLRHFGVPRSVEISFQSLKRKLVVYDTSYSQA